MNPESILRDQLARERTLMANERTLLAYGRTALALLGLALIVFKFGDVSVAVPTGSFLLFGAGFVMFWGAKSYRFANARINGEEAIADSELLSLVETD